MFQPARPKVSRAAAPDVRLVRAVGLATVSVALAAAAHAAAGGGVGSGELVIGWLLMAVVGAVGAGRQRSMPAIMGAFSFGQLGLHLLFESGSGVQMQGSVKRLGAAGDGHQHMHHHMGPAAGAAHTAAHAGLLGHSPTMLAAHLVAVVATGWLLHRVEVVLWRLLGLARTLRTLARRWRRRFADAFARLRGEDGPTVCPHRAGGVVPVAADRVRPSVFLRHSVIRRGPPWVVGA
ncbi:hypothetical protein [Kitasatospora aureofaciens]|uniref:hypothetical protein n=1 Tax=Kitasatospora aureofaciens TaxID=1894 RepID=UPI001C43F905|nr:hypothetical protein [Kitasatospora aureofaciens]MBV6696889.1 hypothetical protein [Kitasatospora aureofaciens]